MKTIGLLGGMSWESTQLYYRLLNEGVRAALGGHHSARIAMVSVDFQEVKALQFAGDWDRAGTLLGEAARRVEAAGADFLLIGANTMHKVADRIAAAIAIPILHIADATGARIRRAGLSTVGLLGTKFTMEEDFYKGYLRERHGLEVLVPDEASRQRVHDVIYDELCLGTISEASRVAYQRVIEELHGAGAQGIIEGCTEITLLIQQEHSLLPLFDTAAIHAEAAVALALA